MSSINEVIENLKNKQLKVKVDSSELTISVDPRANFSKLDLNNLDIKQIDFSDTSINVEFNHKIDDNFKATFKIDSSIGDISSSLNENKTKLTFDIAGTNIDQKIDLKLVVSDTVMSIVSPKGTNDFNFSFTAKIRY